MNNILALQVVGLLSLKKKQNVCIYTFDWKSIIILFSYIVLFRKKL